jgi:hypothetical protein
MHGAAHVTNASTGHKASPAALRHPAFLYRTRQEYLERLLPFICDAVMADHPVLVAVPAPNLAALRDGLGRSAAEVVMIDMTEAGRNPARILGEVLSRFVENHPDQPVCMIGEPIWPSRSEVEYPACVQHEALINRAFNGLDITVVCPYDVAQLDPDVIADVQYTHPVLWQDGRLDQHSTGYAPEAMWARYNQPLASDPAAVRYTARSLADLRGARAFTTAYAEWFGLSASTTADLQLIASELTTASLARAAGMCRLALWRCDGHVVCEARDGGRLDDPLTGRRPYGSENAGGRGLYVVNAVADLVRTHTTPTETTIHAYLRLQEAL